MSDKQENHNAGYNAGYNEARDGNFISDIAKDVIGPMTRSGNEDFDRGVDNGYKDGKADRKKYGNRDED